MPTDKLAKSLTNQLLFYEGTAGEVTNIRKVKAHLTSIPLTMGEGCCGEVETVRVRY